MGPRCLLDAELAGRCCEEHGWRDRPRWTAIAAGQRPPERSNGQEPVLGEWQHGWQHHASDIMESNALRSLVRELGGPGGRINAATQGKARLQSCSGPYAAIWLTICPTTAALELDNALMDFAIRRRLGIAVTIDGVDPHGHARICDNLGARWSARHSGMLAAWRQVFTEAGGQVPDRNMERLLRNTHIPVLVTMPGGSTS